MKSYNECANQTPVAWVKELSATFKSSFPMDPRLYLEERGWHAVNMDFYSDLADKYAHGLPWTSTPGMMVNLGLSSSSSSDTKTVFTDAIPC